MALTHKEAEQLCQKFHQDFADVAAYNPAVHGLNGFAIGLSSYETRGEKPAQPPKLEEEAFCVTVITPQNLTEEKKNAFRQAADEMFNRETDSSDLNFKTISKVTLH